MADEPTKEKVGIVNWFRATFPANRIAAISAFLVSVTVALPAVAESFSGVPKVQEAVLGSVGILGAVITVLKFLSGAQKWEAIEAGATPTE
jgi:preprotein translocase subunit SecY